MTRRIGPGRAAALMFLGVLPGLFPAASADPVAPTASAVHEVSPPADGDGATSALVLAGILIAPSLREAVFVPPGGGRGNTLRLHEGDALDGGTIVRIEADAVIVIRDGAERRLTPDPGRAGKASVAGIAIPRAPAIIRSADPRVPGIASHLPPVLEY